MHTYERTKAAILYNREVFNIFFVLTMSLLLYSLFTSSSLKNLDGKQLGTLFYYKQLT